MCSLSGHSRCRWVCLFMVTFGEIRCYITCSAMDPLQWMGAVMRVQTADKNITIIQLSTPLFNTPVHQLTSGEDTNCLLYMQLVNGAWFVQISLLIQNRWFFTEGSVIMDSYFSWKQLFTSQDINWWTGVVWIIVFLSAVWTLILTAPIHCRASIAEQATQCYISPNVFGWTIPLIFDTLSAFFWEWDLHVKSLVDETLTCCSPVSTACLKK